MTGDDCTLCDSDSQYAWRIKTLESRTEKHTNHHNEYEKELAATMEAQNKKIADLYKMMGCTFVTGALSLLGIAALYFKGA